MAISYNLDMATRSTSVEVARVLCDFAEASELPGAPVTPGALLADGAATAAGTWLRVVESKPKPWNPVLADLGFAPSVSVAFRLGKDSDVPAQQDDMIRLVSGLLSRLPGDAVLHFEYETIWLLRRAGDLSVNERDDLWPARRLALISQPYRRATYHFAAE